MTEAAQSKLKKRGPLLQCKNCQYIGDKIQVATHVLQHHVDRQGAPYFCTWCEQPKPNPGKEPSAKQAIGCTLNEAPDGFAQSGKALQLVPDHATALIKEESIAEEKETNLKRKCRRKAWDRPQTPLK